MRARVVSGTLLILLGLVLLQVTRADVGAEAIVLGIGTLFLVWYAFTNLYGLLVPGCIMTGLGMGLIADELGYRVGIPVLLGLGGGFLAVFIVDWLVGNRRRGGWWPVIPAIPVLIVGLHDTVFGELVRDWWAVGLIVVGVLMIAWRPKPPPPPPAQELNAPVEHGHDGAQRRVSPP